MNKTLPGVDPARLLVMVRAKLHELPRQVRACRARGYDMDDLVSEVVISCITKSQANSGYDPARGDLGGWVYTVARSRLSHILDRVEQPAPSIAEDVGHEVWGADESPNGTLPEMRWGERPHGYQGARRAKRRAERRRERRAARRADIQRAADAAEE